MNFKRLGQYVDMVCFMLKKHVKAHSGQTSPGLLKPYYKYGPLIFFFKLITFNISINRVDPVRLLLRPF